MIVRFKKLSEEAKTPKKGHKSDAAFDFYATKVEMTDDGVFVCHTDIAVEIPYGYVGLCFPRSSIVRTDLALSNCVGVIDSGYTGEVTAKFKMAAPFFSSKDRNKILYQKGERVFQMIIMPIPEIEFEEVSELSQSERGVGGYGSTGK